MSTIRVIDTYVVTAQTYTVPTAAQALAKATRHVIASQCLGRMNAQGIMGRKARETAALHFYCGAIAAMHAVGHPATDAITMAGFLLSVRGMEIVEADAKECAL